MKKVQLEKLAWKYGKYFEDTSLTWKHYTANDRPLWPKPVKLNSPSHFTPIPSLSEYKVFPSSKWCFQVGYRVSKLMIALFKVVLISNHIRIYGPDNRPNKKSMNWFPHTAAWYGLYGRPWSVYLWLLSVFYGPCFIEVN